MRSPPCPRSLLGALALAALGARVVGQVPSQALPNVGFEQADGTAPRGWTTHTWSGAADFAWSEQAHTGAHSVCIRSAPGADAGWGAIVPVLPFSTYRLGGWIKTAAVAPLQGHGVVLNLHGRAEHTPPITGSCDWTRVEITIDTGSDDALQVNGCFGYFGQATGTAWFDDVTLELVATRATNPAIVIDAAGTGEPIAKYVFGQFIEHLGRCIYGGIWAEMVADRKFLLAIGTADSPWRTIGPADGVDMDATAPFVGEHSPRVVLPDNGERAGLAQDGLGVIAGRVYAGRVWLAGDATAAPVEITLCAGDGEPQRVRADALGPEFRAVALRFVAPQTTDGARLEITSRGHGAFCVGAVSLMPDDHVRGLRRDTLALLRELDAPIYRWPGGNFVSGYDWRDGIGERDRRPPRANPAWRGVESNDFGLHEFIDFCREVGAEPLVVVNSGFGDAPSAAALVRYANATPAVEPPASAASQPERPFAVRWWGVGNEMYGSWQLGHMTLEHYVRKHRDFARAMRAADPSIRLVAVGDAGPWSEGMLRANADAMDLISEHFYCQERPSPLGHAAQMTAAVRAKVAAHRHYRATIAELRGHAVRIALDEWNYWYGPELYGEIGVRYTLKDALGIAAGLHEMFRNSDLVQMACYAQTVNAIGCIKTTKTAAAFETTGLVLKTYRRHFGALPLAIAGDSAPLDVAAALTSDRRALTLAVVNATATVQTLALELRGIVLAGSGQRWRIEGLPTDYNEPGAPPRVVVHEEVLADAADPRCMPPFSVTLDRLELR